MTGLSQPATSKEKDFYWICTGEPTSRGYKYVAFIDGFIYEMIE
jgi:hypothetical protein